VKVKVRLLVAACCLVVPSLAVAASTAAHRGWKVTVTGAYKVHVSYPFGECSLGQGHENGWVFGVRSGWWDLSVWAANNSFADPKADDVQLASSRHFEVEFLDLKHNKAWAAGPHIAEPSGGPHGGSGTFSISQVAATGLPYHAKYLLTGNITATLPGRTRYYDDVNGNQHTLITTGTEHVAATFSCWWEGVPPGRSSKLAR
jgi:hypothetical protein